jgi:hypothetical protein
MSDTTLLHYGFRRRNPQHYNGIVCKVRQNNIKLRRPITNRCKCNPKRFSRKSAAQEGLTRLQPHRTSPRLSGHQAARKHRLQPRRISTSLRTRGYPGHIAGCRPELCLTPENQLTRTDSLASSSNGPRCASSPTEYPGTQTPVAGRHRHNAPDHLARRRTGSTRHQQPNAAALQQNQSRQLSLKELHAPGALNASLWVHKLSSFSPPGGGVMWEHHITVRLFPLSASHLSNARTFISILCSALATTQHRFPSEQTLSRSRYPCLASKTALAAPANR